LDNRTVPQDWKEANVTAIHKKGDKKNPGNYRPVSLTSVSCKIMEKIIRKKIMKHLTDNNILSNRQYGFITGRSTLLQLLTVLDMWTECLDRGSEVDVIFLDFQKAFDRVPHNRLLDKMKHYGITGDILQWINSFLKGRRQRVKLHDTESPWSETTSGIPQGSVLGPTLFIIFINSLPNTTNSPTFLFADDAKLFREITSTRDQEILQEDLNSMFDWTKSSLLNFNPEKCSSMTICRPNSNTSRHYKMNETTLKVIQTERDLGVMVDRHLKFEQHIQTKINKANSIMGIIRRTYTYLDADTFLLLYKSLVRPHLEYCNQIWNPHLQKHIISIENVQRRATKQIPGFQQLTYEERLTKLKLPTLKYRRDRGDMIEAYKILTGKYENEITEHLLPINERESRGHQLKLHHRRPNTNLRKFNFTFRIVKDWNELPHHVIESTSTKIFERRLDEFWTNHPNHKPFRPPYAQN